MDCVKINDQADCLVNFKVVRSELFLCGFYITAINTAAASQLKVLNNND